MSERNDLPRTTSFAQIPALQPKDPAAQSMTGNLQQLPQASANDEQARAQIASLEREAKALGADPAAAMLFHQIGLLWEDPLKNPPNAAVAYQKAYKLAPKFLANIRAARRLFADVGNAQMVVQLLDAELAATEDPRTRAALTFEKAQVLEERLSRDEDALKAYKSVLEMQPEDPGLLSQLEAIFAQRQDHASLVEVYLLLASAVKDESVRAHYLTAAGLLLEDRLQRADEAAQCFRQAFAIERKDPLLLNAMKRLAERQGRTDELLAALAAEAELLGTQAGPTYLRIAKVYEKLGRREDALAALLAARRASPTEALVLSELADIYETQGRHEDLADVLLSWVSAIQDESEVVAINLRLAALYEENLKRDAEAIARYQAILQRVPGHPTALGGLGKLNFRTQNWEGLFQVFESESATTDDPKQKAAKVFKAAELLEEKLSRVDDAVARYHQCLQIQPGYLPAQKALIRIFEKQDRWAELVAMYEQDLLQTADRDQIVGTLNKIAAIYEERLSDLDHAIDCMKRILDHAPEHLPTLRNLARLYERAQRWQDLIHLQESESTLVGDTKQVLSLFHRNAEILEEQLKDRQNAIIAYERLLSLSPSYLPALKALGRLYAQDGRWEELIRMYRAEAEIASTTDHAASLTYKIGELYEHRLKNENDAIASYQEVLTLAPSYFPALRALARIYRAQGAWENLIEVHRAEAANRTDPVERANALFQAAAIWEDQLNREDMAIEGYQEVLRLTPGHAASIRALERLYSTRNDAKELIAVLDRETQTAQGASAKVAAYLKLARIYLEKLNEPIRAANACEAILQLEPSNLFALKVLERIRMGDKIRRGELRARLSERVTDGRLKTVLAVQAATDRDSTTPATAELSKALQEDPSDLRVAFALERALRQQNDYAGLISLFERRATAISDTQERVELALRIGQLYEQKLNDQHKALAAFRSALDYDGKLIPALQGARRTAIRIGDWKIARASAEAEADTSKDIKGAVEAFNAAAVIALREQNDADGAVALYRKALERDALDPIATAGMEDILASRGGAADLAALQEKRAEAKLAARDSVSAAQDFYSAAKSWAERVKDADRAQAAVARALTAQPTHPEALELKGQLCFESKQYAEAAAAYALRVQQGGDAVALSALHLKLGAMYQDHLSDATRAAAHLQTALAGDPRNVEALERLANIHTVSRNWTGAADCLKRLLELELPALAQAKHTIALGQITDEGFGDPAAAIQLYRKALELTPGDPATVDRLVQLYERTQNLPELVQLLEQQAGQSSTVDPRRAQALRLRIGDIYAKNLEQPQKAIAQYRQVVEQDPTNATAHLSLADVYGRDPAQNSMAVEEHRVLVRLDPSRVGSFHELFRLWENVRQTDKTYCAASILSFLRAGNEAETALYAEAKNRIPNDTQAKITAADLDSVLHPSARGPLLEVLRAIGDQLAKTHPAQLESMGIDKKADKLKSDHAVFKAVRAISQVLGVEEFEVYQARRGLVVPETTEPLSLCISQDLVRRFNVREQRFLITRGVFALFNKSAIVAKLSQGEAADLFGNSIRIHAPNFNALGRKNDEQSKQLRKAYSRKALKALEGPAAQLASAQSLDLGRMLDALAWSADRLALLMCGDPAVALNLLLKEDGANLPNTTEGVVQAIQRRPDVRELIVYALSDDFFRMRSKLGLALP